MNPYEPSPTTSIDAATPRMPITLGISLLISYLQCYLVWGLCFFFEVGLAYSYADYPAKNLLRPNFWLNKGTMVFVFSLVIFALLSAIDFFFKSTRVRVGLYVLCSIATSIPIVILCILHGTSVVGGVAYQAGAFILPCLAYSLFRIMRQKTSLPPDIIP